MIDIMTDSPFISICIPAYQRLSFLQRLLDSIRSQVYRNFEVIITDDSPDDRIEQYLAIQHFDFPICYYRNHPPKGTPLNWMEGMKYAKGEWIKIIHDDDWFTGPDALQQFASAATSNTDCIFSGYTAYYETTKKSVNKTIDHKQFQKTQAHPYRLFASNQLGPPSVVMFRKNVSELYDPALKWLVDIEAYTRIFRTYRCVYIDQPLITMSYNDTQVTNECFRNPDIEIYEALLYYQKHGHRVFEGWVSYDGWWRLIRNLAIRSVDQLKIHARGLTLPDEVIRIIRWQARLPLTFLKSGLFSKIFMFLSYTVNCIRGIRHHH